MASKYRLLYLAIHCCSKLQLRAVSFRTSDAKVVIASAFSDNPITVITILWRDDILLSMPAIDL